ncbi:MAG TPA: hypothetical protein VKW04_03620 [Planctomycetota bacterium]|nr:hypothetical protein [Planctomycetota bacterium]
MSKIRVPLFVLLVLAVPACGSNLSVPAPLLTDTFSGTFPAPNWTTPATTGTGTTTQITGGVLAFTATVQPSSSTTSTVASFNNPGVSFQVQAAATGAGAKPGIATIEILDHTSAVVASVSWDAGAGTIAYSIAGSLLTPAVAPPPADGTFTAFRFSVDSMGTASWSHNNVLLATKASFPAGLLTLRLGATWSSGAAPFAEIDFDNVTVTNP